MSKISISDFLIQELHKLGITDFFGLPGDYNFNILESIENNPDTNWIGCTNELNAGYAADGYARIKGYGAVVTTYNVGELSALNAVAGSYAETVPIISIVGIPSQKNAADNILVHHNFQSPNYLAAHDIYKFCTEATAYLTPDNAKQEIERVISTLIKYKKPVYIAIPADVCGKCIDNSSEILLPQSNDKNLEKAVKHALELIGKSESPVILGDVLIDRFDSKEIFRKFTAKSNMPATTLIMGKGIIEENTNNFIGTYLGTLDNFHVYDVVNNSDCVISVGTIFSDLNTLKFDITFKPSDFINIQGTHTVIEGKVYDDVLMADILNELTEKIVPRTISIRKIVPCLQNSQAGEPLNFRHIGTSLEKFFKPYDRIFAETGIIDFLVPPLKLPLGAMLYEQLLWASIGWAAPASFGACMADSKTRTILLTGEGSLQLTIQSLSDIAFRNLKPVIFVLNNRGYTIERILSKDIHDKYNNIIPWDYTKLFEAFDNDAFTAKIRTNKEFDEVLEKIETHQREQICFVELFTDEMELPPLVRKLQRKLN